MNFDNLFSDISNQVRKELNVAELDEKLNRGKSEEFKSEVSKVLDYVAAPLLLSVKDENLVDMAENLKYKKEDLIAQCKALSGDPGLAGTISKIEIVICEYCIKNIKQKEISPVVYEKVEKQNKKKRGPIAFIKSVFSKKKEENEER